LFTITFYSLFSKHFTLFERYPSSPIFTPIWDTMSYLRRLTGDYLAVCILDEKILCVGAPYIFLNRSQRLKLETRRSLTSPLSAVAPSSTPDPRYSTLSTGSLFYNQNHHHFSKTEIERTIKEMDMSANGTSRHRPPPSPAQQRPPHSLAIFILTFCSTLLQSQIQVC
jgi:hypothetical protein